MLTSIKELLRFYFYRSPNSGLTSLQGSILASFAQSTVAHIENCKIVITQAQADQICLYFQSFRQLLVGLSLRNITRHKVTFDLFFRAKFWALFTPVHHPFYPRVNQQLKIKHPKTFKLQTLLNILLFQASVTQDYEVRLKKNCCPNKLPECVANFCCLFYIWVEDLP